jgi:formylglycine-generating enzyme required for sulfatase activity
VHYRATPGRENYGVGDISWRAAAIYCNWLHNDQSTNRQSFLNGAYDVATFGAIGNSFTDQSTHNPGAKFWVPTLGEWVKAAYYDPNKGGTGVGGYWWYQNGADAQPIYGAPLDGGQANSGFYRGSNGVDATQIPLMSYTGTQSPWGVMDLAGGTQEWTEGLFTADDGYKERLIGGSAWASIADPFFSDRLGFAASSYPTSEGFYQGFRIAASVPAPGVGAVMFMVFGGLAVRRRR